MPTNDNPPSGWNDEVTLSTGSGNVAGDLDGTVLTTDVDLCVIGNPMDQTFIS